MDASEKTQALFARLVAGDRKAVTALEALAREYVSQGEALENQGSLSGAESRYLRALVIYDWLLNLGEENFRIPARELSERLAELNMQQGNMHGADVYYVKAMAYGSASC